MGYATIRSAGGETTTAEQTYTTTGMINRSCGVLLALITGAGLAHAQTMRSYSAARQVHGEAQLAATVELAAGSLRLAPGGASTLYHLEVIYDSDRFKPQSTYLAVTGEVTLGLQSIGGAGLRVSKAKHLDQAANVVFSPAVDLNLNVQLDAVHAELELGGFRLVGFMIRNGGSRTVVRFSQPNQVRCTRGDFRAGAAEFTSASSAPLNRFMSDQPRSSQ